VIITVVGFAAWNTGNNLLFLVFSLLLSTLFVGWVAARSSLLLEPGGWKVSVVSVARLGATNVVFATVGALLFLFMVRT